MALVRRKSQVLKRGEERLIGTRSVDPKFEAGGLTVNNFSHAVTALSHIVADYHKLLSDTEGAYARMMQQESVVADLSERMLAAVATRFGKDSPEYAQVGGKRKSDRKRRGTGEVAKRAARVKAEQAKALAEAVAKAKAEALAMAARGELQATPAPESVSLLASTQANGKGSQRNGQSAA